jgi:transcriptional regulator with XRE-family HTH domain
MSARSALGRRLASLRDKATLTQAQLGARVGVTGGQVSRWEQGRAIPSRRALNALVRNLDVEDPAELWSLVAEATAEMATELRQERDAVAGELRQAYEALSEFSRRWEVNVEQFTTLLERLEELVNDRVNQAKPRRGHPAGASP